MLSERLFYSRAQPLIRTPMARTRLFRKLAVTPAVDWTNITFLNTDGTVFTSVLQILGPANQQTIEVYRNGSGNLVVTCFVCLFAIKAGPISQTVCPTGVRTLINVVPGQFVYFSFSATRSVAVQTISVSNILLPTNPTVIDTFTVTVT